MTNILSVTEASERMGITGVTLRKWVHAGKFPGKIVTEGRKLPMFLIDEQDVINFTGTGKANPDNPHSIFNNEQEFIRIEKRFDNLDNRITELQITIFKQIHEYQRNDDNDKLQQIIDNQNILNDRINNTNNLVVDMKKELLIISKKAFSTIVSPPTVSKQIIHKKPDPLKQFGGR